MIITMVFTVLYQLVLNRAFGPLFTYLPITFEDEAVLRDAEFQRAQNSRWEATGKEDDEHAPLTSEEDHKKTAEERELAHLDEMNRLSARDQREASYGPGSYELNNLDNNPSAIPGTSSRSRRKSNWAEKSQTSLRSRSHSGHHTKNAVYNKADPLSLITSTLRKGLNDVARPLRDAEAQVLPSSNLFDDIDDELADIEPEARQKLIKRSFQHPATRAIQPAVWVPYDELGVAKDEIERTGSFTKKVWITSVGARLDASGSVIYRGLPPDRDPFENIEI